MAKFTIKKKESISEIKSEEKIEELKSEEKIEELKFSHEQFTEDKNKLIIEKYFKGGITQKMLSTIYNIDYSEVNLIIKEYIEKNPTIEKPNNHPKGEQIKNSKLNKDQVISIRNEFKNEGITFKELSKKYMVSKSTIRNIILNNIWKL